MSKQINNYTSGFITRLLNKIMLPLIMAFTGVILVIFILLVVSDIDNPVPAKCIDGTVIQGVNYKYCLTPMDKNTTSNKRGE